MTPQELQIHLSSIGVKTGMITSRSGGIAMFTASGARLIGLWPDPDGPNVLWTNPTPPKNIPCDGGWANWATGGVGGDRLWFGPEYRWFFEGAPKAGLDNWKTPLFIDPGMYSLNHDGQSIDFRQQTRLNKHATIDVNRHFATAKNNPPQSVRGISLKERRQLSLNEPYPGLQIDLWSIAQIPVGSIIIIPVKGVADYNIAYEATAGEIDRRVMVTGGSFAWKVTGDGGVKGSLPVSQITGVIGVVQKHGTKYTLLIRRFTPHPDRPYLDGLFEHQVDEQCIQWWDGFGFGEVECHSPTLTTNDTSWSEEQSVHAFYGSKKEIRALMEEYLGCNVEEEVFE